MSSVATVRGLRVRYDLTGRDGGPIVVLCHSLGTSMELWDAQVEPLSRAFRVLRFDLRGHGETDLSPEPYAIETLGQDVVALFDTLGIERAYFCGVSLGGFIGQWLGARAPERIDKLVLSNTAAVVGSPDMWNDRIATIRRDGGMSNIQAGAIDRWFTRDFIERAPETIDRFRRLLCATPIEGYAAACAAIRDMDLRDLASDIARPTLVVAGAHDRVTTPSAAEWLAGQIPGAAYLTLDAAHLANVEAADAFTNAVLMFLTDNGD